MLNTVDQEVAEITRTMDTNVSDIVDDMNKIRFDVSADEDEDVKQTKKNYNSIIDSTKALHILHRTQIIPAEEVKAVWDLTTMGKDPVKSKLEESMITEVSEVSEISETSP